MITIHDLSRLPPEEARALIASAPPSWKREMQYNWRFWARENQIPPEGEWRNWLILAGRGFGKSRTGAEWVRERVREMSFVNLVGATADDARDIMVLGEAGILAICPPNERPAYNKSDRKLVWPNGAQSLIFTADEPERLRGKQSMGLWLDEVGSWRYDRAAYDMAMFGLRIGPDPRCVITTTPKPRKLILDLLADANTVVTRGTSYENRANLNPAFYQQIIKRYEGTRLGRQELLAELLMDNPSALWKRARIDELRVADHPPLVKVVIGVDPEVASGEDAAETGIIAAGLGTDGHGYVIDDASMRGTPYQWGLQVAAAYARHRANVVLAEINNGGEMVVYTIQSIAPHVPVETIHASRGKYTRAEPVAALYEQGKVHHVGSFALLEDSMVQWEPGEGDSPDRMDALVWALTRLFGLDKPFMPAGIGYIYGKGVRGWMPK